MRLARALLPLLACFYPLAAKAQDLPGFPSAAPDLGLARSAEYRRAAYPDWSGKVLQDAELQERQRSEGGIMGTISLSTSADGWVSVLYYAQTGRGLELLSGLPVPPGQETALTIPLPPGDPGIVRLIAWSRKPDAKWLERLEARALDPMTPQRYLVDERWFSRVTPGTTLLPYDERLPDPPSGFFRARRPSYSATISPSGVATTRNCSVHFRGPTRFDSDQWGSFGQWQLGAGTVLELSLVMPQRRDFSRAALRLHGQLGGPFSPSEAVSIRIEVNGWRSNEAVLGGVIGEPEQVLFDLSQDIEYGLNTLSLRSSAFGTDWLLRSIELWVE